MHLDSTSRQRLILIFRAVIEIAFIVFLYYSNLLMGEFTKTNGKGKSITFALSDIFTGMNFSIAIVSALVGWAVIEYLRQMLSGTMPTTNNRRK
jgi:hypothetical protein